MRAPWIIESIWQRRASSAKSSQNNDLAAGAQFHSKSDGSNVEFPIF